VFCRISLITGSVIQRAENEISENMDLLIHWVMVSVGMTGRSFRLQYGLGRGLSLGLVKVLVCTWLVISVAASCSSND